MNQKELTGIRSHDYTHASPVCSLRANLFCVILLLIYGA
jgi:hypothetical protein